MYLPNADSVQSLHYPTKEGREGKGPQPRLGSAAELVRWKVKGVCKGGPKGAASEVGGKPVFLTILQEQREEGLPQDRVVSCVRYL